MTTNNSWDSQDPVQVALGGSGVATITGVITGNGTSPFTGSAITQYDVLVGGAANAISSITPSTAGLVLTSNGTSANPTFQSVSASGAIITVDGDIGSATSNAGVITISGGTTGLVTTGSVHTVTVSGTLIVANGGTGATTLTGVLTGNGTSPFTASAITQHDVLVGGATNAITSVTPSTAGFVLTSNGVATDPSFKSISSIGGITTIDGDSGSITPTSGTVTISGGTTGLTTSGSSSTMDLTGTLIVGNGGTGATTLTGVLTGNGTSEFTASTITQYGTVIAGASNAVTSVAPSATSGVPLISQGSSSNPAYGTAVVAGGGTGNTSFTAYALIAGGTTSTAALQQVSGLGTSGQFLVSQGAGALPQWTTIVPGVTWTDQGTSITIASNHNYFATAAVTLTLPASPAQGDTIVIDCDTSGTVVIQANTGQYIRLGNVISASAGSSTNSAQGDSLTLTYRSTGSTWHARAVQGNWNTV